MTKLGWSWDGVLAMLRFSGNDGCRGNLDAKIHHRLVTGGGDIGGYRGKQNFFFFLWREKF